MTETSSGSTRRRADDRGEGAVVNDPFALLGLPTRPGLSDDDVRAAWRRIAAATHPDREDGGDPARFGAAAAAYAMLRTGFGRGEALADLGLSASTDHRGRHAHGRRRSADPSVQPAGRHRARRGAGVGRRTGVRLSGLTRLRGWIARVPGEAAAPDPADAGRPPWTRAAPDSRRLRRTENMREEGSPGGRMHRDRWRLAGWSSRWRVAAWQPDRRPAGSRLGRRPIRRPGAPALRVGAAAVMGVVAVVISGWSPGVVGVLIGVLTWLLVTAGHAFSRRRSR